MNNSASRLLLDCTLRDGGYVNNWAFDTTCALHIRNALYASGVRYIELGIMGRGGAAGKSTKFASFDEVTPLLADRKEDCAYCVMITQTELPSFLPDIPPRSGDTVDIIRLAYFKPEAQAALASAHELKKRGYKVFLQAMATFMYSREELAAMLEQVNVLRPSAFYMVDSFSTMYNDDVTQMTERVLERLHEDILFGFHAHNNLQMAYSNAVTFINTRTDRPLILDGSIFGMGRGAGNAPLELLMEYMNQKKGERYQISEVLRAYERYIKPIFEETNWGYSIPYFLTASKGINSVYGWYLARKRITEVEDISAILDLIPEGNRHTLAREQVDRIITEYREREKQ